MKKDQWQMKKMKQRKSLLKKKDVETMSNFKNGYPKLKNWNILKVIRKELRIKEKVCVQETKK